MPTPSIQTLRADAQQVLNLDSISAVRSVVAATLANANAGTPLNPNLTTQQLWNEFYQIVTQPKSDIESIIANQLMKFLYAPPAPGGVGADKQVIFNDGGVLAGDPQFLWNKTTNLLTVTGSATITGDLTVDTSTLKVDSTNNRVGVVTATPRVSLDVASGDIYSSGQITWGGSSPTANQGFLSFTGGNAVIGSTGATALLLYTNGVEALRINNSQNVGIGVTPSAWASNYKSVQTLLGAALAGKSDGLVLAQNCYYDGTNWVNNRASTYSARYDMNVAGNSVHAWYVYNGVFGSAGNTIPFVQAMTLNASGNLLVARTGAGLDNTSGVTLAQASIGMQTEGNAVQLIMNRTTSDGAIVGIRRNNLTVGDISVTTTGTTYNTTSDYRLKESVQPLVGGLARISALKPSIYKWKADGSNGEGFLAHELAEVVPFAVSGEKDAVNEDGSIKPQGVDLSKVVPILVAAIQELTARVQTLETR